MTTRGQHAALQIFIICSENLQCSEYTVLLLRSAITPGILRKSNPHFFSKYVRIQFSDELCSQSPNWFLMHYSPNLHLQPSPLEYCIARMGPTTSTHPRRPAAQDTRRAASQGRVRVPGLPGHLSSQNGIADAKPLVWSQISQLSGRTKLIDSARRLVLFGVRTGKGEMR